MYKLIITYSYPKYSWQILVCKGKKNNRWLSFLQENQLEKVLLFKVVKAPENTNHNTAKVTQISNSAEKET